MKQYLLISLLLACSDNKSEVNPDDKDGDLVLASEGDCNDDDPHINPYVTDIAGDGIDQNCDGVDGIDSDGDGVANVMSGKDDCFDSDGNTITPALFYADADGDGYGNVFLAIESCSPPLGFVSDSSDCNDLNAAVHPSAQELCDGVDNTCDGNIDQGLLSTYFVDADGDGYGNADYSIEACSQPTGYVENGDDCDDGNAWAYDPMAAEICDTIDNNCNGEIDEGVLELYYEDADGDGYGSQQGSALVCTPPEGYVSNASDCNDANSQAHDVTAPEICDGLDNNCDGNIDEGVTTTYYLDMDGDGFGLEDFTVEACSLPQGYATIFGDCNDYSMEINPDSFELCDGLDNTCDGNIDVGLTTTYYADTDTDGYGAASLWIEACTQPLGYVVDASDCDDGNAHAHDTETPEICDGYDNNCNGTADEGVTTTYYLDMDGDGFGLASSSTQSCNTPQGYSDVSGDCNDVDSSTHPDAIEVCDEVDNDCDGDIDGGLTTRFYADFDEDGFGDDNVYQDACSSPPSHTPQSGDCDDLKAWVYTGAPEVCDGVDNNCDGLTDDADATVDANSKSIFYVDADGDGYGLDDDMVTMCAAPSGYSTLLGDCDDDNAGRYPGLAEVKDDGIDQDCDGKDEETIFVGNVELSSSNQADAFCLNYKKVMGSLTLSGTWSEGESLACLQKVEGDLHIHISNDVPLNLSALSSVGGDLLIMDSASTDNSVRTEVSSIQLDSLSNVGGQFRTRELKAVDAPLLKSIGGALRVENFTDLDLSAFESATLVHLSCDASTITLENGNFDGEEICETLKESSIQYSVLDCEGDRCLSVGWSAQGIPESDGSELAGVMNDPGFKRLTRTQFVNSLIDLHYPYWHGYAYNTYRDHRDDLEPAFKTRNWGGYFDLRNAYPDDQHVRQQGEHRGGLRRLDDVVYQEHSDGLLGYVRLLAQNSYQDWYVGRFHFSPCESDYDNGYGANVGGYANLDEALSDCYLQFVDDFGLRALRRPLTDEEREYFIALPDVMLAYYPDAQETSYNNQNKYFYALQAAITFLNTSPEFFYHIEVGDEDGNITAYELASRLSYHFWDRMPDEELFEAAADGSLLTEEGYAEQVERLYEDPRSAEMLQAFYEDYFRTQEVADIGRKQRSWFDLHVNYVDVWTDWADSINDQDKIPKELSSLGVWYSHTNPGTFAEMFNSDLNFLTHEWYSERSYLSPAWDGESVPDPIGEVNYVSLLTRLSVVGSPTTNHRPVLRGLYIREALLCEVIPLPEDCSVVVTPAIEDGMTVRQTLEAKTEQEGSSCESCHSPYMNGLGYATGHFNGIGSYMDQEMTFEEPYVDGLGYTRMNAIDWAEIDTTGEAYFDGQLLSFDGAQELNDILVNSGKLEECFARTYFRHTMKRKEWLEDEALIQEMTVNLYSGDPISEVLKSIAYSTQFKTLIKPVGN